VAVGDDLGQGAPDVEGEADQVLDPRRLGGELAGAG
jgi:hypothetical protein